MWPKAPKAGTGASVLARALVVLAALLVAWGGATPVAADPLEPPEFKQAVLWPPPITGLVVRDGTPPDTAAHFPVYPIGGFGCDFLSNSSEFRSHFGFTGTIDIELLNLPPGVTSQTPGQVTITGPTPGASSSPDAAFVLQAAADAQLGDATVTLRATSGDLVQTRDLPIRVVDELPACTEEEMGTNPLRPDRVTIDRAEFDGERLRVEATECCLAQFREEPPMAWVTVAATGEVIGALEDEGPEGNFGKKFKGEFTLAEDPQQIKVIASPLGGWQQADTESD